MFTPAFYVKNTPKIYVNKDWPRPALHKCLFGQFVNYFEDYHPLRAGCIPYAYMDNHFYFFLSIGYNDEIGDFGGGITKKEDTINGALRECLEESSGIFGFHVSDVKKKGFIVYSEEMAVIFVPVHRNYIRNIRTLFQHNVQFYNRKKDEMKQMLDLGLGLENKEEVSRVVYEYEVVKTLTEKSDILVICDTDLFSEVAGVVGGGNRAVGPSRNYSPSISNILLRSQHLLQRNLQRTYIQIVSVPYKDIIQKGKDTFSDRKNKKLEADICSKSSPQK